MIGQSETLWFWFYDTRLNTAILRKVIGLKKIKTGTTFSSNQKEKPNPIVTHAHVFFALRPGICIYFELSMIGSLDVLSVFFDPNQSDYFDFN